MIDLNQPPVRTAGLVLFADDERPPVWHVVPERPVLGTYRVYTDRPNPFWQHSSFESPVMTTEASTFIIDPRDIYREILVFASAVFDSDQYRYAFVDVKAEVAKNGWSHTETIRIGPETPDGRVRFRLDAGATFTLQQRYRSVTRAGQVIEPSWQPAGEGVLLVGNPPVEGVGIG